MIVKSGVEKIFLDIGICGNYFPSLHKWEDFCKKTTNLVTKTAYLFPHGGIPFFFLDHFSPSFLGQKWYF
jgi:hypothetical protein